MLEKNNIEKILEIFFDSPRKDFHIRELSRMTRISAPTVILAIKELQKEGLVIVYKKGNLKLVKASWSQQFLRKKRVRNIQKIYESELIDYLSNLYNIPKAIVLFGSFSRGDDIENSDIDIAILTNESKEHDLESFQKFLNRKISIHEIYIKKISKEFYNNIINGIVMEGAM